MNVDPGTVRLLAGIVTGVPFGLALGWDPLVRRVAVVGAAVLLATFLIIRGPEGVEMSLSGPIERFMERSEFAIGAICGAVLSAVLAARLNQPRSGTGGQA